MMTRRIFTAALAAASIGTLDAATGTVMPRLARAENGPAARNVVLVHGLFADGSCWSEVIVRLQAAGLNVTSVQNPLTTLDDAIAEAQRVLDLMDQLQVGRHAGGHVEPELDRRLRMPIPGRWHDRLIYSHSVRMQPSRIPVNLESYSPGSLQRFDETRQIADRAAAVGHQRNTAAPTHRSSASCRTPRPTG